MQEPYYYRACRDPLEVSYVHLSKRCSMSKPIIQCDDLLEFGCGRKNLFFKILVSAWTAHVIRDKRGFKKKKCPPAVEGR